MYNGGTPIAGGIGTSLLAITGADPTIPLMLAAVSIVVGGLLFARSRWLQRNTTSV